MTSINMVPKAFIHILKNANIHTESIVKYYGFD